MHLAFQLSWVKNLLSIIVKITNDYFFSIIYEDDIDLDGIREKPKEQSMLAVMNKQILSSKLQAFKGKCKMINKSPCLLSCFYVFQCFRTCCRLTKLKTFHFQVSGNR